MRSVASEQNTIFYHKTEYRRIPDKRDKKFPPPEMGMRNFPGCHKGQGATEYLVLLAVVLVVALVSVALLGFFPGMASDAQMTQSQIYWRSASPIAITEWGARYSSDVGGKTQIYMKIRNTGSYPIRLSKLLANGLSTSTMCIGTEALPLPRMLPC